METIEEFVAKIHFGVDSASERQVATSLTNLHRNITAVGVAASGAYAIALGRSLEKHGTIVENMLGKQQLAELKARYQDLRKAGLRTLDPEAMTKAAAAYTRTFGKKGFEFVQTHIANMDKLAQATQKGLGETAEALRRFGEQGGNFDELRELNIVSAEEAEKLRLADWSLGGKGFDQQMRLRWLSLKLRQKEAWINKSYSNSLDKVNGQLAMMEASSKAAGDALYQRMQPHILNLLKMTNQFFDFLENDPVGQFIADAAATVIAISAIGLGLAGLNMLIMTVGKGFGLVSAKTALFWLKLAMLAGVLLVIEDLWKFMTDPNAKTIFGKLVKDYPDLKKVLDTARADFKELGDVVTEEISPAWKEFYEWFSNLDWKQANTGLVWLLTKMIEAASFWTKIITMIGKLSGGKHFLQQEMTGVNPEVVKRQRKEGKLSPTFERPSTYTGMELYYGYHEEDPIRDKAEATGNFFSDAWKGYATWFKKNSDAVDRAVGLKEQIHKAEGTISLVVRLEGADDFTPSQRNVIIKGFEDNKGLFETEIIKAMFPKTHRPTQED